MAVQSTKTRMEATASGVAGYVVSHNNGDGTYSKIHVQNETDLDVYVDGVLQALTTDYTVSIVSNEATVTFNAPPTTGAEIVVVRKLGLTQGTSYINNDIFDAATLEDALDKLTLQAQQLDESISRSVRFGDTVANAPDPTIDISASERAGKILGFNSDGTQFVTSEFFGTYRGSWTDGEVYNPKDIVRTFDQTSDDNYGSLWVAKIQHTASASTAPDNTAPLTGNTYWDVILDTSFFATQTDLTNTSAGQAESWAKKTDGIIDNTDYSAKAYAIGGDGVTNTAGKGPAKDWAIKTGGTVDGTEYSAKEYATGTTVSTGSAKAWANTDEDIEVTTNEYSALHYNAKAQAAKTDAVTAKNDAETARNLAQDWANKTNGTVDGTNYSAKHWATQTNVGTVATNIGDINDVATSIGNVTTVANSINNVNTVATGIADVNRYADEYTISANAPANPSEGDLWYDSTNNALKVWTASAWAVIEAVPQALDTTDSPTFAGITAGTADINGGTIDGTDITVGSGKTLNVSDGTLTLADNQITAAKLANDAKVVRSATAPASPTEGDLWYDSSASEKVLKYYNGSGWFKVSNNISVLDSVTGNIFNTMSTSLTLGGTGFLSNTLVVSFLPSGGSATTVNVTASSDTAATVTVPSAIYNLAIGTSVEISVTNADGMTSNSKTVTILDMPGTAGNPASSLSSLLSDRGWTDGSATEGIYWFDYTGANPFPTAIHNVTTDLGTNTWLMIQKNFVPHAYKNGDGNNTGVSYGLLDASSNVIVTSTIDNQGASVSLGSVNARVSVADHFNSGDFNNLLIKDRTPSLVRYNAGNSASTLYSRIVAGMAYNDTFEDNVWYAPTWSGTGGARYIYFNTRMTAGDYDTMKFGLTYSNSVTHDAYNTAPEHYGTSWFRDGDGGYTTKNNDSFLLNVYGQITFWVR